MIRFVLTAARGFSRSSSNVLGRFRFLFFLFVLAGVLIIFKLGYLQIAQYGLYSLYASDQHELAKKLQPTRGQILVRDKADGTLHPLATNRLTWQIYAVPKEMKDPVSAARVLSDTLHLDPMDVATKLTRRKDDPYELLVKDADAATVEAMKKAKLDGVGFFQTTARLYPEKGIGGQLVGFVREDAVAGPHGQYGIEGAFDTLLAGTPGSIVTEADARGRRLTFGRMQMKEAENGADIVLTIDRTIQYQACELIQRAITKHRAESGSLIILNPTTGAVMAMCSAPDFDPSDYRNVKDLQILNNPVVMNTYEPGSVFKPFTLAA